MHGGGLKNFAFLRPYVPYLIVCFCFNRNCGFARDPNLAEAAAISVKAKWSVDERTCFEMNVLLTFDLVVSFSCYGPRRASINTLSADSL